MSRTIRNRTPSGKLTAYLHYKLCCELNKMYYSDRQYSIDKFIANYRRDGAYSVNYFKIPPAFKRNANRKKKAIDKSLLYNAIKNDTLDNMASFKWYNDAHWLYD